MAVVFFVMEERKDLIIGKGMYYSFEHDTFWTDKDMEFIILNADVEEMSDLEFLELCNEIDKVLKH